MSDLTEKDVPTPEEQEATVARQNPIITPADTERFPLLEMVSQSCSTPIEQTDEEAIVLMDALLDALDPDAVGLAAVQVGHPHRIFLLRNGVNDEGDATNNAYINPVVTHKSHATKSVPEACLSLPHMHARCTRPKSITIKFVDLDGEYHTETFTGFWAQAVSHELDHLDGILISHHLEKEIAKQPHRNSFGMKITPQRTKTIARRRAKNKRARKARTIGR
jgi:peptide deformylase